MPPVFVMKTGGIEQCSLCLGFRGNRREIPQIVIFAPVGDGFQVFDVSPMGDAHTGNLTLFCHIYCLLLFYKGIVGKLIPCNPAAFLHKPDDAFCVGAGLRNLIQCLLHQFLSIHIHRSFEPSVCKRTDSIRVVLRFPYPFTPGTHRLNGRGIRI